MSETGFFKTATLGGFDKRSVLNYIDSLNEKFHAAEAEHNEVKEGFVKAQESQIAHIKHLESLIDEQNAKMSVLAEQVEKERAETERVRAEIAEHETRNTELQKRITDGERELQIQLERGRQLQFKAESLDYKSKKYDDMSAQIGGAMLEAKRTGETIIAEANAKALEIGAQAHNYMRSFFSELSTFSGDSTRLRKSIEEILFVLNDRIDVMQDVVSKVEQRFQGIDKLDFIEEPPAEPPAFSPTDDRAGYFGTTPPTDHDA